MIIDKDVKIKINKSNLKKYPNFKIGDNINFPFENLSLCSHVKVSVKCDICNSIKQISYQKYNENINRQNYYTCSQKCGNFKRKITNLERYQSETPLQNETIKNKLNDTIFMKYGVINPFQSDVCKDKIKQTNIEKYGCEYPMQNTDIKNKSIKNRLPTDKSTKSKNIEYDIYKNDVRRLTNRNKKILFEQWDGYDFYDNEYIKNYLTLDSNDRKYPTIDHKIPKHYGYLNNIHPDIISNMDNLCITKRTINSHKNIKII